MWVRFLGQEDHPEEGMATHSSILPRESHGQRSLAGYGIAKSRTRLKKLSTHYHTEASQLFLHYPLGFPHLLRFSHIQRFHLGGGVKMAEE